MTERHAQALVERLTALETKLPYIERTLEHLTVITSVIPKLEKAVDSLVKYTKYAAMLAGLSFLHIAGTPIASKIGEVLASSIGIIH